MKKFKNIDDLHAYLERKAHRIIKYYYTDWKNYDRPEVMKATGTKEKEVYIIFRESGSYFFTAADIIKYNFSAVVMDYYTSDRTAEYYRINFDALTAERIPAGLPKHLKKIREENERRDQWDRMSA